MHGSHLFLPNCRSALRMAMLAAVLLTNGTCDLELLVHFYMVAYRLKTRMEKLCDGWLSLSFASRARMYLGYLFIPGYKLDLDYLLGSEWQVMVTSWMTNVAVQYASCVQNATNWEITAMAFIVHRPLVSREGRCWDWWYRGCLGRVRHTSSPVCVELMGPGGDGWGNISNS